jgi:hypothetical protein
VVSVWILKLLGNKWKNHSKQVGKRVLKITTVKDLCYYWINEWSIHLKEVCKIFDITW